MIVVLLLASTRRGYPGSPAERAGQKAVRAAKHGSCAPFRQALPVVLAPRAHDARPCPFWRGVLLRVLACPGLLASFCWSLGRGAGGSRPCAAGCAH